MGTRYLAWVGLCMVALSGRVLADEVDEVVRQLQQDAQQIQAQAQKALDARKRQAAEHLEKIAREMVAAGNEAGATKAREVARQLGGKPVAAAPVGGKKAEVLWSGTWFPATVLETKEGKFFIKYDGYGDNWNEWVGPDRIRFAGVPPQQTNKPGPAVGKKAQVFWGSTWYDATVLDQKDGKYYIQYDGYGDTWNEWVGEDRIRIKDVAVKGLDPNIAVGKPVQVEWGGQWWPAVVLQAKDGKFFVKYDSYSDASNEWVGSDRIRGK